MRQVIVVTGASSGFGALAARALADAGHTVYASMRETKGRNAPEVKAAQEYSMARKVDLRAIELDVASQESADAAIRKIVEQEGRWDVVVHNAGHMVFVPADAFTPEQFAKLYDVNVFSTQRVNRAALPQLRMQGRGMLVRVSSSSGRRNGALSGALFCREGWHGCPGGAIRAGAGALGHRNIDYRAWAFTKGTNHFAYAGVPADMARLAEYEAGPYKGYGKKIQEAFAAIVPDDADVGAVAEAIVKVVDAPFGKRPFRVHVDPTQDGADVAFAVMDRLRTEMLHRVRLDELLTPVKS